MRTEDERAFEAFVASALPRLRRLAFAWCRDWHRADDLVAGALERVYGSWPRLRREQNAFAYTRTTMVRLLVSEQRRPWWRREVLGDEQDDPAGPETDHDTRLDLVEAVGRLTPGQRAVVLLRYLEDLPVADVARLLGVSEGTVKSQTHAALAALRRQWDDAETTTERGAR